MIEICFHILKDQVDIMVVSSWNNLVKANNFTVFYFGEYRYLSKCSLRIN